MWKITRKEGANLQRENNLQGKNNLQNGEINYKSLAELEEKLREIEAIKKKCDEEERENVEKRKEKKRSAEEKKLKKEERLKLKKTIGGEMGNDKMDN